MALLFLIGMGFIGLAFVCVFCWLFVVVLNVILLGIEKLLTWIFGRKK